MAKWYYNNFGIPAKFAYKGGRYMRLYDDFRRPFLNNVC